MTVFRRISQFCKRLRDDESGATGIEMLLLIAAVILPSAYIIDITIDALVGHYQMITFINSLPFP